MKGMTLTELLITVLIWSVIAIGFYNVLGVGNRSYAMNAKLLELQQQSRNGLDRMVREVRQAEKSSIVITTISATSDKISFKTTAGLSVQYYLTGNNLTREAPANTKKVIAHNIGHLKFAASPSGSPKTVKIEIRASKTFFSTLWFPRNHPLTETVVLRNA